MIIRDKKDRFVVSFDSEALFRKVVDNDKNAKIAFESGIDHANQEAFTITGDVNSVWNSIVESGHSCISRI